MFFIFDGHFYPCKDIQRGARQRFVPLGLEKDGERNHLCSEKKEQHGTGGAPHAGTNQDRILCDRYGAVCQACAERL